MSSFGGTTAAMKVMEAGIGSAALDVAFFFNAVIARHRSVVTTRWREDHARFSNKPLPWCPLQDFHIPSLFVPDRKQRFSEHHFFDRHWRRRCAGPAADALHAKLEDLTLAIDSLERAQQGGLLSTKR